MDDFVMKNFYEKKKNSISAGVDLWLAQNDEFLLRHLSTSPEVEPPHFAMQVNCYSFETKMLNVMLM